MYRPPQIFVAAGVPEKNLCENRRVQNSLEDTNDGEGKSSCEENESCV